MSAVDQHCQLNHLGASLIHQCVHGGADRAACVQNVIEQNDLFVPDRERERSDGRFRTAVGPPVFSPVISIRGDVQFADRQRRLFNILNFVRNSSRQKYAAGANSDEHAIFRAFIFFHNFMGNPEQRPANGCFVHQYMDFTHGGPPC